MPALQGHSQARGGAGTYTAAALSTAGRGGGNSGTRVRSRDSLNAIDSAALAQDIYRLVAKPETYEELEAAEAAESAALLRAMTEQRRRDATFVATNIDKALRALLLACHSGALDEVQALVARHGHGLLRMKDDHGCCGLHFAAMRGDLALVRWLVHAAAGGGAPATSETGASAPSAAAATTAAKLAAAAAAAASPRSKLGWEPLHYSAHEGHIYASLFLVHAGANPAARTTTGMSPLDAAASGNHVALEGFLIDLANGHWGGDGGDLAPLPPPPPPLAAPGNAAAVSLTRAAAAAAVTAAAAAAAAPTPAPTPMPAQGGGGGEEVVLPLPPHVFGGLAGYAQVRAQKASA